MSFSLESVQGDAQEIEAKLSNSAGHDREQRVLEAVKRAVEDIAREVGGYVSISGSGHINPDDGLPGDSVNVQVNSLLAPSDPTPDAGLAAAGGSAQNFPPEASTAAPMPGSGSDPAAQEPIPQPDPSVVPPVTGTLDPQPNPAQTPAGEVPEPGIEQVEPQSVPQPPAPAPAPVVEESPVSEPAAPVPPVVPQEPVPAVPEAPAETPAEAVPAPTEEAVPPVPPFEQSA